MSGVKGLQGGHLSVRVLNEALEDVLDGAGLRHRGAAAVEGVLFLGGGI